MDSTVFLLNQINVEAWEDVPQCVRDAINVQKRIIIDFSKKIKSHDRNIGKNKESINDIKQVSMTAVNKLQHSMDGISNNLSYRLQEFNEKIIIQNDLMNKQVSQKFEVLNKKLLDQSQECKVGSNQLGKRCNELQAFVGIKEKEIIQHVKDVMIPEQNTLFNYKLRQQEKVRKEKINKIQDKLDALRHEIMQKIDRNYSTLSEEIVKCQKSIDQDTDKLQQIQTDKELYIKDLQQLQQSLEEYKRMINVQFIQDYVKEQTEKNSEKIDQVFQYSKEWSHKHSEKINKQFSIAQQFQLQLDNLAVQLSQQDQQSKDDLAQLQSSNIQQLIGLEATLNNELQTINKKLSVNLTQWFPDDTKKLENMSPTEARLFTIETRLKSEESNRLADQQKQINCIFQLELQNLKGTVDILHNAKLSSSSRFKQDSIKKKLSASQITNKVVKSPGGICTQKIWDKSITQRSNSQQRMARIKHKFRFKPIEFNNTLTPKYKQKMSYYIEGAARILNKPNVFINPSQVINRDLSILVIQTFINANNKQNYSLLEPLSATGIRGIRYYQELNPKPQRIILNDIDTTACQMIQENTELNNIADSIQISNQDAIDLLYSHRNDKISVIDLDPYGSIANFLDGGVQALENEGLLCITSTDMQTLCGYYQDTAFYKYGGVTFNNTYCHELGIRILLHQLQQCANRYQRAVVPLLSISMGFYVRIFVQMIDSGQQCKNSILENSLVFQCTQCPFYELFSLGRKVKHKNKNNIYTTGSNCPECQGKFTILGPIYSGYLHQKAFIQQLTEQVNNFEFQSQERLIGLLKTLWYEGDTCLYFDLGKMSKEFKCDAISLRKLKSAVRSLGGNLSQSHTDPKHIKTDLTMPQIFDIFRHWVNYIQRILKNGTKPSLLADKPPEIACPDFTLPPTPEDTEIEQTSRFIPPPPNTGPKAKAK